MKRIKGESHRNKLDIILTDLQPVETPQIYTMRYFYNYLIKEKSIVSISKKQPDSEKGITCPNWHAAPLKYHTLKDNNELREMSYINLVSMIEVCLYLEKYESFLLNQVNKQSFSIRKHRKRKDLIFKNVNNSQVEYNLNKSTRGKEAAGNFYEIGPFARLDYFYKSSEWFDLNRKYKYFGKSDYSKCFDSIYTHTFNWVIAENTIDAKEFNKKHFLSATDRLLQNMNMSITNGIVVGPEFSRLLAEVILQAIDSDVIKVLMSEDLIDGVNYSVKRYVDDIFIFANREEDVQKIIYYVTKVAEKYKLRINDEKKMCGKLPHIWSGWISSINNFQKIMIDYIFHPITNNEILYLIKEKNLRTANKIAKIKELFQNVIISDSKMNVKIVSYCLTIFFNKIKLQKNNDVKKTIFNFASDKVVYNLFDIIFYIYSYASTYNNTEKLISIINVIENEIGEEKSNHNLRQIFCRYSYIFENGNFADYTNLIILCAIKKIYIGDIAEKKSIEKLDEESNPILYSVYLLYDQRMLNKTRLYLDKLENLIKENLYVLEIEKNIFLNPKVWWIFAFFNCPYISISIKSKMEDILKNSLINIKDISMYGAAKKAVIDFFLDTSVSQKIIDWNISKELFYKDITFRTFERTLFNNPDMKDDYNILDY